jgi:hypothetical protein
MQQIKARVNLAQISLALKIEFATPFCPLDRRMAIAVGSSFATPLAKGQRGFRRARLLMETGGPNGKRQS